MSVYTLGVYGKTEEFFFDTLIGAGVNCLIDIRQRRGVRGAKYSFVNSIYFQEKLKTLGIEYLHVKSLAPTTEIRNIQKNADIIKKRNKSQREFLSPEFCCEYEKLILDDHDFELEINMIEEGKSIALFCVEKHHLACHRHIVAKKLQELSNLPEVINL